MTTPFEDFDTSLRTAFSTGTSNVISQGLSAVASPFTALIVLWVIVQSMLVMRGDLDARRGISRIIRVTLVSAFILEAGIYNGYVVNLFQTVLPTWAASSVSSSTASTPKLLDDIWNSLVNYSATIDKQLHWFQVVDLIELAMIAIADGAMLTIAFAIYICSSLMTAVILSLGPFVIAGFLFDATRNISERWIGKLVGLALLSLLVDVTMIIVATVYGLICWPVILMQFLLRERRVLPFKIMEQTAMFIAVSTFILISLPAAAAFIGGGVSLNPAGAILNTIIGGATGGVGTVAKAGANIGRKSSNK